MSDVYYWILLDDKCQAIIETDHQLAVAIRKYVKLPPTKLTLQNIATLIYVIEKKNIVNEVNESETPLVLFRRLYQEALTGHKVVCIVSQ